MLSLCRRSVNSGSKVERAISSYHTGPFVPSGANATPLGAKSLSAMVPYAVDNIVGDGNDDWRLPSSIDLGDILKLKRAR